MNEAIRKLMVEERQRKLEREEKHRCIAERAANDQQRFAFEAAPCLASAAPRHYRRWLKGFLALGGKPTHFYDYFMPRRDWYIARKSFIIFPLYGAYAVQIIIPPTIEVDENEGLGHNHLFYINGYTVSGSEWVPVFSNTKV